MRIAILLIAALLAAEARGEDEPTIVTRVIDGQKATFPEKSRVEGVKALVAVLEACHSISDGTIPYTADDLKKARKGDHVRLMFAKPLKVHVLGRNLDVSEAVYADGAFLLLCGDEVVRCTKYRPAEWERFSRWSRQTLPAD